MFIETSWAKIALQLLALLEYNLELKIIRTKFN